jgi:hypothetical protein
MSIFSDTVTVYNGRSYIENASPKNKYFRTVLSGVFVKESTHRDVSDQGVGRYSMSRTITIPVGVDVPSGKTYVDPETFAALPMDDENHWTLSPQEGSDGGDIIVLGECGEEITEQFTLKMLKERHKTCAVVAVDDNTRQPRLKHWAVTGV